MTTFNSSSVNARHNRPSTTGRTLLEFHYLKNGVYADPYKVHSVNIFALGTSGNADEFLDLSAGSTLYGLVASSMEASGKSMMVFSGNAAESAYVDAVTASSIYKKETGKYGVVLKPGLQWVQLTTGSHASPNTYDSSTVGRYFDIWTVQDQNGGGKVTYIHEFELFDDTIISLNEPLMVETRQKLSQKYINKNSKVDLQITTDHTVTNRNVSESIKNIFTDSVINNAAIRIIKYKDDVSTGLPYTEIQAWTSTGVSITSGDTVLYSWDTSDSAVGVGTYEVQTSSVILGQNILSDKFTLVVR